MAERGATSVAIVVSWQQRDMRSTRIAPSPKVTASDRELSRALDLARQQGLAAVVFPILVVEETGPGKWRGTLRPKDVGQWWLSYERFILHYAAIAARHDAEALVIGSELGFAETWRDRWYHLISRIERIYDGELIYSSNWDHFEQVSFAHRLDRFGVSAYFPLSKSDRASYGELARTWRRHRDRLVAFARQRNVSLWLTEVGYPSRNGAAVRPWHYGGDAELDVEEQRRCFAALIAAWHGVEELDGLLVWNWWGDGGLTDTDYTPRGKPAEALLQRWFTGPASSTR